MLYRSIRAALPADSVIRSMPSLAGIPETARDSLVSPYELDELPEVLTKVPPVYPNKAREEGWEGTVTLQVLVGIDGRVRDAFVHHWQMASFRKLGEKERRRKEDARPDDAPDHAGALPGFHLMLQPMLGF